VKQQNQYYLLMVQKFTGSSHSTIQAKFILVAFAGNLFLAIYLETFMKLLALLSGLFFVAGNAMAAVKTCQTAAEIKTHVETEAAEEFCFHKVENPAIGPATGNAVSEDMQLAPNLQVAFLNTEKNFDDAQVSCASLGAGWHAPASSNLYDADPRATDNSNSAEAVSEYFAHLTNSLLWSMSMVSGTTYGALCINLGLGGIGNSSKRFSYYVVCVRP